jgi:hypothetical protein
MTSRLYFNPLSGTLDLSGPTDADITTLCDPRYLRLDQTTPQTVINGVPLFNLGLKSPKIYPNADSTTAFQINKADGTTNVFNVDTTNRYLGICCTPTDSLDINASDGRPYLKLRIGATASTYIGGETYNCLWGFNRHPSRATIDDATKDVYAFYMQHGIGITWAADTLGTFETSSLRMRLLTNGNLGIGNLTPATRLVLSDSNNAVGYNLLTLINTAYNNSNDVGIRFTSCVTGGAAGIYNTGRIVSYFNGSTYAVATIIIQNPTAENVWINTMAVANGKVGVQTLSPTAYLHIRAGSATAGTAPIKLTSGTLLSTPEPGAIEYDGTHFYGTDSGGTRHQLD